MICERCKKETAGWRMSMFNTQNVCLACIEEEKAHPDYAHAHAVERQHCLVKDFNFKGVGLPLDLQQKYGCDAN